MIMVREETSGSCNAIGCGRTMCKPARHTDDTDDQTRVLRVLT